MGRRNEGRKANNSYIYAWSTAVCRPRFSRKSPESVRVRTIKNCTVQRLRACFIPAHTLQLAHLCYPLQTCAAETQDAGVTYPRFYIYLYDTIWVPDCRLLLCIILYVMCPKKMKSSNDYIILNARAQCIAVMCRACVFDSRPSELLTLQNTISGCVCVREFF